MNIKILLLSSIFYSHSYGAINGTSDISSFFANNKGLTSVVALGLVYYGTYSLVRYRAQTSAPEIDLMQLDLKNNKEHASDKTQNYLFAHGIASTHKQAERYASLIKSDRVFSYNFPDVTRRFYRVNFWHTALGQNYEVMHFKEAYDKAQIALKSSPNPDKSLVLMGVSRGATTILNFMAKFKPKGIKALILESPFDTTRSITDNKINQWGLAFIPGMQKLGHLILSSLFWQHSTQGEQALNAVSLLDKNLPILLICSKQDPLVPASSTIALYEKLQALGHKNTHIFIAEQGKHGKITEGPDAEKYQRAVDAFSKEYGISVS